MTDRQFYPDNPCSEAPLRPGEAPQDDCYCKVCLAIRVVAGPVRPGTPEWDDLIEKAKGNRG